jgi:glucose/arabinose dehydrogenase
MQSMKMTRFVAAGRVFIGMAIVAGGLPVGCCAAAEEMPLLTGKAAMGDWSQDAPGVRRKITAADLPPPYHTPSAREQARVVARPSNAWPKAPVGFKVEQFATGLRNPRVVTVAPNGDVFVMESGANRVHVFRDADGDGKPEVSEIFASGLDEPFGIAFFPVTGEPQYIYLANTGSVIRYKYRSGDLKATGAPELIVKELSAGGHLTGGGHWTRDLQFSADGKSLFVSIGSKSNVSDNDVENQRARIFQVNPDGTNMRVYAWGIRNPVGLAVDPQTGALWTSVNERDGLGDDLPPEYVTKVKEGGFYGWPWYYIGGNQDPRHAGKHPELKDKVIVPDVLIQAHSASLDLAFYTGNRFPERYRNQIFVAQHGSWNRQKRTGYKVVMVPVMDGEATGEYEDFLTGFVTPQGEVWGRPVGVATAKDGALLVTDDGSDTVWRVVYAP